MSRPNCNYCKFWKFSRTLGSLDVPVWHCRFGFSPSEDCLASAYYNVKCINDYFKKHPNELQLSFNFK